MRKIVLLSLVTLIAIAVTQPTALAAIPEIITFQGELKDSEGSPVDGEHGIEIYIFDEVTGGTLHWQEAQTVIFSSGLFTVRLGEDTNGNPLDLDFDQQYWLGISIDEEAELSPRTPLTSNPYAFRAKYVDEMSLENIQQFWALAISMPDADGDGYIKVSQGGDDCDDFNPEIHPGAAEICNGVDDDCDGTIDNDTVDCPEGTICLNAECVIADADGDGYNADVDCDDNNPNVYPGAPEYCNGIDDDCDGQIDNADVDGDGYMGCFDDCDDTDPDVHPGAPEICGDDIDNDCDGQIDNVDNDNDGYYCYEDCDDSDPNINPGAPEICNGFDDNCDGQIDNADVDGDGYMGCFDDCDDTDPDVHPGAPEICDGIDNNCDGMVDDVDEDGDGFYACTDDCDDSDPNVNPQAPEICGDGIDNNCDGTIDEGCP